MTQSSWHKQCNTKSSTVVLPDICGTDLGATSSQRRKLYVALVPSEVYSTYLNNSTNLCWAIWAPSLKSPREKKMKRKGRYWCQASHLQDYGTNLPMSTRFRTPTLPLLHHQYTSSQPSLSLAPHLLSKQKCHSAPALDGMYGGSFILHWCRMDSVAGGLFSTSAGCSTP